MADVTTINAGTRLIKPGVSGADDVYPMFLSQVHTENPDWSLPTEPDVEFINSLGYFVVNDVERPTAVNQVVEEGHPVFDNGAWKQVWVTRDYSAEEAVAELAARKTTLNSDIAVKTAAALDKGFLFDFGDGKPAGHIQLRDGDRANLSGIRIRADAAIVKNDDTPLPFRDLENVIHFASAASIVQMSDAAYLAYQNYLVIGWSLKDQITVAETLAALPTIPDVFELPAA